MTTLSIITIVAYLLPLVALIIIQRLGLGRVTIEGLILAALPVVNLAVFVSFTLDLILSYITSYFTPDHK